jgi:thiol-disulfide isomerase/thioredoxin
MVSVAQNKYAATLQLVYPTQLAYDTLLVKDDEGKIISETSKITREGKTINTYLINVGSITGGSFTIYFGDSLSEVNDSLYFLSRGKDLLIELKDSFALRNRIHFKLRNVYNFDELYQRYIQYCSSQMQKYDSLIKASPDYIRSKQQYLLKAGLDFVKKNVENPYSIDLFAVFVISPQSHAKYSEANQFYVNNLKNRIKEPKIRRFVEQKMEILKHSVEEGNKAPFFSARSIHNQLINSDSLLGKNVLLNFWATWCVPCMKELPSLKGIYEKYKEDNLVMISISLDRDSLKMANMVIEKKMNWLHIFNNNAIRESFQVNPIPHTFLIDEKGVIIYNSLHRENGAPDPQILESFLKQKFKHS